MQDRELLNSFILFCPDLAGIMGLHSLINQDQYHASLSDKNNKADPNIGWDGITKVRRESKQFFR
jgi:hypothetical protein